MGGQIQQSVSPYQLKIMWQYFYNAPSKWYWRFSEWMWPVLMPALMFFILWQKIKADAEEEVRLPPGTKRRSAALDRGEIGAHRARSALPISVSPRIVSQQRG